MNYKGIFLRFVIILVTLSFLIWLIWYCFFRWETLPDGRKFRTHFVCTMSHTETNIVPVTSIGPNNQVTITTQVQTNTICDAGYTDTTWQETKNETQK